MAKQHGTRDHSSAADALTPLWRGQADELRALELQVRAHGRDAVHHFRVATRRLRSELSAFESLLEAGLCRALGDDLRRTAAAMGGARDTQVVRSHLEVLLAEMTDPAGSLLRHQLMRRLDDIGTESRQRSLDHLDTPAYDQFTRSLDRFAGLPPWLPAAAQPAEEALRPLLRSEWSRFLKKAREALDLAGEPVEQAADARLHEARKASKRARYVAESLIEVFGRRAQRLGQAAERVQTALGEHQDSVLTQTFLADARTQLSLDPAESLVLTSLEHQEAEGAEARRADFEQLFAEADQKCLRSWLR